MLGDSIVVLLSIAGLTLTFLLPHGKIQNGNIYLYDSSNADLYQRPTVWDRWWQIYSAFASILTSALCVLVTADTKDRKSLKIAVALVSILLHVCSMLSISLVHQMDHSAIADTSSAKFDVKTTVGAAVWIQVGLPFLSYYKHIAM